MLVLRNDDIIIFIYINIFNKNLDVYNWLFNKVIVGILVFKFMVFFLIDEILEDFNGIKYDLF